ncbi:vWA domain-containing protein [Pseudoflavonifractor capillosus]|uniref:VWA domain-containing protein n=1 Tax=Pseudoflavonifractor capillosus TaxID=106588 RepID=A0A921STL5_9FIRM|nr:vWA domain-containing protein [Pseudoflavonifractor capillosus]HJG87786.1 VWA domain-containing protein [Pseudoflavonifractor capillosus]
MGKKRGAARLALTALAAALCLVWSGLGWGVPRAVAAESAAGQPYNIALLIDKSGSMNATDPERLAVSAAGMFVNSLYTESLMDQAAGTGGVRSRVGVISFSADTETETIPVELTSEAEVSFVAGKIDAITYDKVNTGATDLGRAVLAGTEMLKDAQDGVRKNMIILFTDGYTDALSPEGMERSAAMMAEGLEAARQLSCEIYVVGLNYQGRINDQGRAEIWNIANSTQSGEGLLLPDSNDAGAASRVNYLITDSRQEVSDFYNAIFGMMMGSGGTKLPPWHQDGWTYYSADLTSPGIFCANIYIISDGGIGGLALWDPSGSQVDLSSGSVRLVRGNGYALMTITAPAQGIWTVGAEGEVSYDVTLVPVTGITLRMDSQIQGGAAAIRLEVLYMDQPQDEAFYAALSGASCTVTPEAGGEAQTVPLTYSQEEGVLTGAFTVPAPGRYMIQAAVTAAQMTRTTTQTLEFTMGGAPIQVAVGHGASVEVDLAARFLAGWDSVTLTVEDVSWTPEERLDITPGEAGVITIRGLSTGEASFTVHAVDSLGQVWDIPGTVEVTFSLLAWLPLILAVLAALIAAAVLLRQRMCRLPGDFTVTCACGDGYSVETIAPPRGSSFTLYTLVMNSLDPGSGSAGMRRIVQAVRSARAELSSPGCRIRIARRASGRNRYRTYRLGRDGRALGGEVFRDDESGLTIEVEWLPPEE